MPAQSVSVAATHEIYDFLGRMNAFHLLVNYRDDVKPLSRKKIAEYLNRLADMRGEMTPIDREAVDFYRQEFFPELRSMNGFSSSETDRWHLYSLQNIRGNLALDIVGGYQYEAMPIRNTIRTRSAGIVAYGSYENLVGSYISYRNYQEAGTFQDASKMLTPEQSQISYYSTHNYIDYDKVDAQISIDVSYLTFSVEKMPNSWGPGKFGELILSPKPSSYPQIKIQSSFGDDIDFTYLHAWLSSDIIDSTAVYISSLSSGKNDHNRYLAAHILEMTLHDGIDFAIGESEVYSSDHPEWMYLVPVMVFRAVESSVSASSSHQLFGAIDITSLKGFDFYGALFLDDFSFGDFHWRAWQRNQLGMTVGVKSLDLFYPNTNLQIEYTRVNPWAYDDINSDVSYRSSDTDLGHWIGQNADLFDIVFSHRPTRSLNLTISYELLRKGGREDMRYQNINPIPDFLYGPLIRKEKFGIAAKYEPFHDLILDFRLLSSSFAQEGAKYDPIGVPIFQFPRKNDNFANRIDVLIGISYGLY